MKPHAVNWEELRRLSALLDAAATTPETVRYLRVTGADYGALRALVAGEMERQQQEAQTVMDWQMEDAR